MIRGSLRQEAIVNSVCIAECPRWAGLASSILVAASFQVAL